MLATEPRLAIVWDEGYTLGRENRIRLWFRALRDPAAFARNVDAARGWSWSSSRRADASAAEADQIDTRAKLFDRAVLAWFWPFAREEPHGHPPFYALVGLIGDLVVPGWPDLPRARFGPILVFSLTAGCSFGFIARRWGIWAGAASAGAWALQPQLFGHGHYAAYDALLTCLWVDAILAFWLAVEPGDDGAPPMAAVGLGDRVRGVAGLGGGYEADGVVPGAAVPGVGGPLRDRGGLPRGTPHPNPPPQGGGDQMSGLRIFTLPLVGEGRVRGGLAGHRCGRHSSPPPSPS